MTELTDDERKTLIRMLRLSGADDASSEIKAIDLVNATIKGWAGCITEPFWDIWVKWFDSFGDTWDFPSRVAALMNNEQPESEEKPAVFASFDGLDKNGKRIVEGEPLTGVDIYESDFEKPPKESEKKSGAIDCGGFDWLYLSGPTETPLTETIRTGERREIDSHLCDAYRYIFQDGTMFHPYIYNPPDFTKIFGVYGRIPIIEHFNEPRIGWEPAKPKHPPAPASFARQLSAITEVDPFPRIGWPGRPEE